MESDDPTVIRSIAVTAEDVVTALEAAERAGRETVLRVTPPFSGRMRARLHEAGAGSGTSAADDGPSPIHVDPQSLVASDCPDYPDPAETEDELRSDPQQTYSRDRHRERHAEAVADWRDAVPEFVVDEVTLTTGAGTHTVAVTVLG